MTSRSPEKTEGECVADRLWETWGPETCREIVAALAKMLHGGQAPPSWYEDVGGKGWPGFFTLTELSTYDGRAQDVPPDHVENLRCLAWEVLMPLRVQTGRAVVVTRRGGYRTIENHQDWCGSGRAKSSYHLTGHAVDIRVKGLSSRDVFALLDDMQHRGRIPMGGLHDYGDFCHVDDRGKIARW